jgi:hypothetical protein
LKEGSKEMDDKQLETLVARKVRSVLKKTQFSGPYNVLGILTHMGRGIQDLFNSLAKLAQKNQSILIWTTEEIDGLLAISSRASSIATLDVNISTSGNLSIKFFDRLEYIIFGGFSFELAQKLAQFEDTNSVVNTLLQGLLAKIPVYIITPFPPTDLSFEYGPSGILTKELSKRLSLLLEMGFKLVDIRDLEDQFLKYTPTIPDLITEAYLDNLEDKKSEIHVPHTTIITPLALEKAKTMNIRIIKI